MHIERIHNVLEPEVSFLGNHKVVSKAFGFNYKNLIMAWIVGLIRSSQGLVVKANMSLRL